jgi:hypothetical protein
MIDPVPTGSFLFLGCLSLFQNLQAKFDGRTELPIEIQDICDALVEMGYQDDIRVVAEEMDLDQLLGTYVQWREPNGVYTESKWVSLIVYPSNVNPMLQRLICAKELVHVCDAEISKTNDPKEIMELAQVLSNRGGAISEGMQITNVKVAADVLAQQKASMLLFPKAARLVVRQKISDGLLDIAAVEQIVQIPRTALENLLDPAWEDIVGMLSKF